MRTDRLGYRPPPSAAKPADGGNPGDGSLGGSTWLLTFTDLVCLILTFFVMSYAMAAPEQGRWREVTKALSLRLNPVPEVRGRPDAAFNIGALERAEAMSLDYLSSLLKRQIGLDPDLAALAGTERRDDRLVVTLPAERLFADDRDAVSETGWRALMRLAEVLGRIDNRIEVSGITDPDPPDATAFQSRWELALRRAQSVASALTRSGYRREVVVRAGADVAWVDQPTPVRRVEIVVLDTKEN